MTGHHEVPMRLAAATEATLRDLAPDESVNISYEPSSASADAWVVMLGFADGSRTGFEVVASQWTGPLMVALADGLQQALIDHFQVGIPQCPRHAHPLVPIEVQGAAVWTCPQSDESWPIGSLSS